jgi:hypothetical protein
MKNPQGLTLATIPAAKAYPTGSSSVRLAMVAAAPFRRLISRKRKPTTKTAGMKKDARTATLLPRA